MWMQPNGMHVFRLPPSILHPVWHATSQGHQTAIFLTKEGRRCLGSFSFLPCGHRRKVSDPGRPNYETILPDELLGDGRLRREEQMEKKGTRKKR